MIVLLFVFDIDLKKASALTSIPFTAEWKKSHSMMLPLLFQYKSAVQAFLHCFACDLLPHVRSVFL